LPEYTRFVLLKLVFSFHYFIFLPFLVVTRRGSYQPKMRRRRRTAVIAGCRPLIGCPRSSRRRRCKVGKAGWFPCNGGLEQSTAQCDKDETKGDTNNQQQVLHDDGPYLEEREERERRKVKVRDYFGIEPIRVQQRKLTGRRAKGGCLQVKRASKNKE
jgi:hypothetical protein